MIEKSFINNQLGIKFNSHVDSKCRVWFKAKEVAQILGYKKTENAINRHVSENHKRTFLLSCQRETRGQVQNLKSCHPETGCQQKDKKGCHPETAVNKKIKKVAPVKRGVNKKTLEENIVYLSMKPIFTN